MFQLNWFHSFLLGQKSLSFVVSSVSVVAGGSTGSAFTLRGRPAPDFAAVGALPLAVGGGCGGVAPFPDEELASCGRAACRVSNHQSVLVHMVPRSRNTCFLFGSFVSVIGQFCLVTRCGFAESRPADKRPRKNLRKEFFQASRLPRLTFDCGHCKRSAVVDKFSLPPNGDV